MYISFLAETIADGDYGEHLALLINPPEEAKFPKHSLELGVEGIDINVDSDKTELIYFK